jgi:outer membrane protein assembly factor BamB
MKNSIILLSIVFITSLLFSCSNSDPLSFEPQGTEISEEENEKEEDEYEFIPEWVTEINPSWDVRHHDNSVIHNNEYIIHGACQEPATLYSYDLDSGENIWSYISNGWDETKIEDYYYFDGIIICATEKRIFGFDIESKSPIWEFDLESINVRIGKGTLASNYMFYQIGTFNYHFSGGGTEILYEINPRTGSIRTMYSQEPNSLGTFNISPPIVFNDTNNSRQLLIFNETPNADAEYNSSTQDLVAMDMQSLEVVWKTQVTDIYGLNLCKSASEVRFPPINYDDRIIINCAHNSVYGFDILTGETLWEYEDPISDGRGIWGLTSPLIHENLLYVNENDRDVTCLNPESGELIWNNSNGGHLCNKNMQYYKNEDLLVFTNFHLIVLDAVTGRSIFKETQFDDSSFGGDVVFDEDRNLFLTTAYKNVIAFKIIKKEKIGDF